MKVCFFIANLGDGGAQRQCIALLNLLQHDPQVDVHLILLGSGEHEGSLDVSHLHVHRTEVSNFASPFGLAFVVRTLQSVRPDVLISWLHPADIWSFVATRIVRGIPWVITERGSAYPDALVYNVRKRFGCRGAAEIIANSEPGKRFWEALAPRAPIRIIPNIVLDSSPENPNQNVRVIEPYCLFVGRLEPQKNVHAMVAAFGKFAVVNETANFILAGQGGQSDEVAMLARDGAMADRVELLGFRRDVPALMSRARVLLSFSKNEGMPNALMEAVIVGLIAVVSDIPEHRALLGDDYPYYVGLESSAGEAAAVIARAWDGDTYGVDQIYQYARNVLAKSTPDNVARAYVDAFAEVITRSKNSAGRVI